MNFSASYLEAIALDLELNRSNNRLPPPPFPQTAPLVRLLIGDDKEMEGKKNEIKRGFWEVFRVLIQIGTITIELLKSPNPLSYDKTN